MSDLISRDKFHVCAACNKQFPDEPCEPAECEILLSLDRQPTIDAAPVAHGEWIMQKHDIYTTCACSQCGTEFEWSLMTYNYCPNCGAKMDGGK